VSGTRRKSISRSRSSRTVAQMSLVFMAMCCTPGPLYQSRYSSIWLFFLPSAGSLIGSLIFLPSSMTLLISAEYSVLMSSSVKCASCEKPITRSYQSTQ
jgi:hypothetical protein